MPKNKKSRRTWMSWTVLSVVLLLPTPPLMAQQTLSVRATFPTVQFTWNDTSLKASLARLVDSRELAIVLDRRLDPTQAVTTDQPASPLDVALEKFAATRQWGVSRLPHVLYLGPQATTRELATVMVLQQQRLAKLPPAIRKRWTSPRNSSWPEQTEPKELVASWALGRKISLHGAEQIPHDLWAAQPLPPMNFIEQATIALAGFDLSINIGPKGEAQVIPLPRETRWTQTYRAETEAPSVIPDALMEERNTIQSQDRAWVVCGSAEFHAWVQGELKKPRSSGSSLSVERTAIPPQIARQRFTLTVRQQPLEAILNAVARQTQSKLEWTDGALVYRHEPRTVETKNATFDALMSELLRGLPIQARSEAGVIYLEKN